MTTLIFKTHPTGTTIGYDSLTSQGDHAHQGQASKVFANNGVVIGVAGDVLVQNILRYAPLPSPEGIGWDVDRWLSTSWLPAVREALEAAGALRSEDGKIGVDAHLLIVVNGAAYEVPGDLSFLRREDGLLCAGSGWQYALGALSAGVSVRAALEIAVLHDKSTGGPLTVIQAEELLQSDYEEMRAAA